MIFPVNPESAQTITGHPEPIISACSSNSSRYQVFHIQHTPNVHKIFIPTNLPRPAGHLYYFTDTSPQDRPQTALPLVADIINSPDHMGNIHESRFVGFIASEDLHHVEKMIKDHSEVLVLEDADPLPNDPARCEVWVRAIIEMLLDDGILEAPPPEPATAREHRLPRHHHTAHCIHQRLHSHHLYRRRNRPSVDRGH